MGTRQGLHSRSRWDSLPFIEVRHLLWSRPSVGEPPWIVRGTTKNYNNFTDRKEKQYPKANFMSSKIPNARPTRNVATRGRPRSDDAHRRILRAAYALVTDKG